MSKISIVSLISDQPIPNILFIRELLADKHIFISTERMNERKVPENIMRVCGLSDDQVQVITVVEDSLEDIRKKLSELNPPAIGIKYRLNLTGGTKIMSIGVNKFFEEYDHESFYVPIEKNAYRRIYPRDEGNARPFTNNLSLFDYLHSYGFEIKKAGLPYWASESLANRFFGTNRLLAYRKEIKELQKYQQEHKDQGYPIPLQSALFGLFDHLGFTPILRNNLKPDEIQFIISGWWEAYVYYRLKRDLKLEDNAIAANCHIDNNGVVNELDVAFVLNNSLFVVECKTGFAENQFKDSFNNAVYKMAAIRSNLGLRIPGLLFMLDSKLRGMTGIEINTLYSDRARFMNISLADKVILNDPLKWKTFLMQNKLYPHAPQPL